MASDVLVEISKDARNLPRWAPAFADAVEAEASGAPDRWQVEKDGKAFSIQAVVQEAARTVDYLREVRPGITGGAYLRVLPRLGGGSVVVMTVPVPAGGMVEETQALLSKELQALTEIGKIKTAG